MIWDVNPESGSILIFYQSRIQVSKSHRIRIRNTIKGDANLRPLVSDTPQLHYKPLSLHCERPWLHFSLWI
jgi:hypothetical protein